MKVMTTSEVAAYLRVHCSTIYRMLKRRAIPAIKVGSDYRFSRDAIDEWMRRKIEEDSWSNSQT